MALAMERAEAGNHRVTTAADGATQAFIDEDGKEPTLYEGERSAPPPSPPNPPPTGTAHPTINRMQTHRPSTPSSRPADTRAIPPPRYPSGPDEEAALTRFQNYLAGAAAQNDDLLNSYPDLLLPLFALPQLPRPWTHPALTLILQPPPPRDEAPPSLDVKADLNTTLGSISAGLESSPWVRSVRAELAELLETRLLLARPPALLILHRAYVGRARKGLAIPHTKPSLTPAPSLPGTRRGRRCWRTLRSRPVRSRTSWWT